MSSGEARESFRSAIEENLNALYGLALRLTRNEADAEDLVGEAVTKAWSAFATLEDRDRFRPWIFRILHNCFVSNYRKRKVRPVELAYTGNEADGDYDTGLFSLLEQMPDAFLAWWSDPEQEYVNSLMREEIARAIDDLPEAFRAVVILINVEGLSYDETAEVLGIPSGTVRSRMRRGRTLLQKNLWSLAHEAGIAPRDAIEETAGDR